jgi:multiple sugar transport system substrate-binding protein
MLQNKGNAVSRRALIKAAGSAALVAGVGASIIVPGRARAQQKTLKILQWNHFVPGYDKWFNNEYVKEWGKKTTPTSRSITLALPA